MFNNRIAVSEKRINSLIDFSDYLYIFACIMLSIILIASLLGVWFPGMIYLFITEIGLLIISHILSENWRTRKYILNAPKYKRIKKRLDKKNNGYVNR